MNKITIIFIITSIIPSDVTHINKYDLYCTNCTKNTFVINKNIQQFDNECCSTNKNIISAFQTLYSCTDTNQCRKSNDEKKINMKKIYCLQCENNQGNIFSEEIINKIFLVYGNKCCSYDENLLKYIPQLIDIVESYVEKKIEKSIQILNKKYEQCILYTIIDKTIVKETTKNGGYKYYKTDLYWNDINSKCKFRNGTNSDIIIPKSGYYEIHYEILYRVNFMCDYNDTCADYYPVSIAYEKFTNNEKQRICNSSNCCLLVLEKNKKYDFYRKEAADYFGYFKKGDYIKIESHESRINFTVKSYSMSFITVKIII